MTGVEQTSIARLARSERDELEAILKAHRTGPANGGPLYDRFRSDLQDAMAWWILLLVAAIAGMVASGLQVFPGGLGGLRFFAMAINEGHGIVAAFRSQQFVIAFAASLAVAVAAGLTWFRNSRGRGFAVTSFGILRVKGPALRLLRHANLAGLEWTRHATRSQGFSVLKLKGNDGGVLTLYVTAAWVRLAIVEIDRVRAAAGLPLLARTVPE